jgi:hypothetical protein
MRKSDLALVGLAGVLTAAGKALLNNMGQIALGTAVQETVRREVNPYPQPNYVAATTQPAGPYWRGQPNAVYNGVVWGSPNGQKNGSLSVYDGGIQFIGGSNWTSIPFSSIWKVESSEGVFLGSDDLRLQTGAGPTYFLLKKRENVTALEELIEINAGLRN